MEALGRHHDTFDDTSLQMRPMLLNPLTAVFVSNGDRLSTLGAADLLVFHIESFCIHTAVHVFLGAFWAYNTGSVHTFRWC
jgi:hypothetical protein